MTELLSREDVVTGAHAPVAVEPGNVHTVLARSILADGLDLVLDLDRSVGAHLVDARTGSTTWTCSPSSRPPRSA